MSYEHILVDAEEGVGIVTLNRPDKLNAMNRQLSSELHAGLIEDSGAFRFRCGYG
jgi:enoyl-CoA hydratase